MTIKFRDINFGLASAELEGLNNPELLLKGYFDQYNVVKEARDSSKFLFLGYKGSGKSAISEHLKLVSGNQDQNLSISAISLADLPYSQLKEIVWGDAEPESKYPTAWSWLILLSLFDSFAKDTLITSKNPLEFSEIIDFLKNVGLLPLPTWRQLVLVSSKRSFRLKLPDNLMSAFERNISERGLQIQFLVDKLCTIGQGLSSNKKHLLVIDGLDDILTSRKSQYDALAALILASSRLNLAFQSNNSPAKIIILCRTDLFEKLPGANKNKIRQDSAIQLDWYHDTRQPTESNLVKLINFRAHLADPSINDLFKEFFPSEMDDKYIATYLLELTRHTPRDFIQLMKHIQNFAGPYYINREQILSGVRDYSVNYFYQEILDELVGYASDDDVKAVINLIGSLKKRDFFFNELQDKAKEDKRYLAINLESVIISLYECSALGNIHSNAGISIYTFKFRNRNSTLNISDRLILHKGIWKAMNLI